MSNSLTILYKSSSEMNKNMKHALYVLVTRDTLTLHVLQLRLIIVILIHYILYAENIE